MERQRDPAATVGFAVEEIADGSLAGYVTLWGGALPHRYATLAIVLGPHARGREPAARQVTLMSVRCQPEEPSGATGARSSIWTRPFLSTARTAT